MAYFENIYFILVFILINNDKLRACDKSMIQSQEINYKFKTFLENRCLYFDQLELFLHTCVQDLEVGAYIRPSTFIRDPRVLIIF